MPTATNTQSCVFFPRRRAQLRTLFFVRRRLLIARDTLIAYHWHWQLVTSPSTSPTTTASGTGSRAARKEEKDLAPLGGSSAPLTFLTVSPSLPH